MEFIIKGKLPQEEPPKDTFVVVANVMHGDADHYEDDEFHFSPENKAEMTDLIRALYYKMDDHYRDRKIPDFYEAIHERLFESDDAEYDWKGDVTCDGINEASCVGVEIIYYDESGLPFKVQFKGE